MINDCNICGGGINRDKCICKTPPPAPSPIALCKHGTDCGRNICLECAKETPSEPAADMMQPRIHYGYCIDSKCKGCVPKEQASADEADKAYIKFTQRFGKSSLEMAIAWHESWRAAIEFVKGKK